MLAYSSASTHQAIQVSGAVKPFHTHLILLLLQEILEHWGSEIQPTCLLRWGRQAGLAPEELQQQLQQAYQQVGRNCLQSMICMRIPPLLTVLQRCDDSCDQHSRLLCRGQQQPHKLQPRANHASGGMLLAAAVIRVGS
jgi:hypothetical protein